MFTYRENRTLLVLDGQLEFPNRAEVAIVFGASPVLGDRVPGITIHHGSIARVQWNANTGRTDAVADTPFPPPALTALVGDINFEMSGHSLLASWDCESRDTLLGRLGALHFVLPLSLNLCLNDSPLVASISGTVGGKRFEWIVEGTAGHSEVIDVADRDSRILKAIEQLPVLCRPSHQRLIAACSYFQRAVRLVGVGDGPAEFAGEAIVNLAKCLEVLFPGPQSREAVRAGLRSLEVGEGDIEGVFVKCQVLRSELDAAHVRMAMLSADEKRSVQLFFQSVLEPFRALLNSIVDRASNGEFEIAPYEPRQTTDDDLGKLIKSLAHEAAPAPDPQD